ncbi:MAG: hypothetical protein Tsb0013_14250 [Phycisphaerales bacterium]
MLLALVGVMALAWVGHTWSLDRSVPEEGDAQQVEWVDALGERFTPPDVALIDAGANVGLLLLGSWFAGRLFRRIGLPSITGYLCFGILVGPSSLGLVTDESKEVLQLVNDLAVALIALTAGAELRFKELRGSVAGVVVLSLGMVFGLGIATVGAAPLLLSGLDGVGNGEGMTSVWVVGLLAAPIMVANSPAVILALINETGVKGAMVRAALAITVCKDLLLVVLFAVVMTVAGALVGSAEGVEGGALAASLARGVPGSILAGVVVGLAMAWYLRVVNAHLPVFIVCSCFGIAIVSGLAGFEALIVALVAGVLMENVYPDRSETLFTEVNRLSLPVYCVFFSVAGAKLDLGAVGGVLAAAVGFIVLRTGSVWIIAWAGSTLTGLDRPVRRWLWTAFVPQAGVSLALAAIIQSQFAGESWADGFYTLMLSVIAVHELAGPVMMKLGIARSDGRVDSDGGGEG